MRQLIVRRLLQTLPMLFFVSVVCFAMIKLAPGIRSYPSLRRICTQMILSASGITLGWISQPTFNI